MDGNANLNTSKEWYQKILLENGIKDKVEKVTVQESGAKNDGLASLTQCVTVEFEQQSGRKPLQLFVKIHTDNPTHEKWLNELLAFEKESEFFMKYLPEAKQLCNKNGMGHLMDIYPKCYYGDKSIIILENLTLEKGYELYPRDKRHDFEATTLVLDALAKHHAVSYAMIGKYGLDNVFKKFPSFQHDGWNTSVLHGMIVDFFENALITAITILQKNVRNSTGKKLVQKLKECQGKTLEMFLKSVKHHENDKLHVLIHGDFKGNNMMFRKSPEGKLEQIIIDLQVVCYKAPAFDINYYFYASVDPKLRQSRLNDLLSSYLTTFNKTCADLGYPSNVSYEDILMQFKRKADMGLFYGLSWIGPGFSLMKDNTDIDVKEMNMDEFANLYNKSLQEWIEQNPEQGKQMADEIVNLMKEHEILSQK